MTPFRYKARILPDGHLPVPEEFHPKAGQEVEVSITSSEDGNGEAEALQRADHLLRRWAGVARGSGTGVAGSHDDHLYRR
jgi:hypothetical protein